jgi:tetratricopeptide (TPR) repeat protein
VLHRNNAERRSIEQMNINLGRVGTVLLVLGVVSGNASWAALPAKSRQAVAIDPKVVGLVKQAGSELKLDQYDAAIRHFTAALQMKPETKTAAAIYSWRADAYIHKGELERAMSDASESIRLNPRDYRGYLERGIVYRRTGRLDKAIGDYDTTIRLNPNFARVYYDRAIAYALKGDYDQAIRDNTQAIRLNPNQADYADSYYNLALDYQAIGNLDSAMADFNEAIRREPKELNNYCGRANTFEDMGQLDKASADYDQVTRLNPRDASDYGFRGSAYFAKGNYREAAFDFEKAAQLSPRDYDALARLAWFQATCPEDSLRNGKEALEKSLRACELSRWQSAGVVDTLAAACAELGDFDRAVKYQTQAINMKGVYALRRKKMQERLELYRQHKPYRKESKFKPR